jgi:hypothetical protein
MHFSVSTTNSETAESQIERRWKAGSGAGQPENRMDRRFPLQRSSDLVREVLRFPRVLGGNGMSSPVSAVHCNRSEAS